MKNEPTGNLNSTESWKLFLSDPFVFSRFSFFPDEKRKKKSLKLIWGKKINKSLWWFFTVFEEGKKVEESQSSFGRDFVKFQLKFDENFYRFRSCYSLVVHLRVSTLVLTRIFFHFNSHLSQTTAVSTPFFFSCP